MAKNERTSKSVAGKASKLMRTSKSKNVRSVAASALTQMASQVKSSARTGIITRRIARSVVKSVSNTRKK